MNWKKPPTIEMWVEFKFVNPTIAVEQMIAFLQEYKDEYPKMEVSKEDQIDFRQTSPSKLPEIIGHRSAVKHIRGQDSEGRKWLHLTPNQLVCSFLKLGVDYPGFRHLKKDALTKLEKYCEMCSPVTMEYAAIHYVDIIDVPVPDGGIINLRDYFTLGVDLPEGIFGSQVSFMIRTTVMPNDGTGPLDIQLKLERHLRDERCLRFRMDWHKVCENDAEIVPSLVGGVLQAGHDSVMSCFTHVFTDRTQLLFE